MAITPQPPFGEIVLATERTWKQAHDAHDEATKQECLGIYVAIIRARQRLGLPDLTLDEREPGSDG